MPACAGFRGGTTDYILHQRGHSELPMSLGSFLKKQFIDVIAWTEDGPGILQYRFPMQDMEIQNGAQLTVRESQMAVFVNEGVFADIFSPGLYTLNTKTLPLLTNLRNWDKLFQSPFKSDVYFYSTRQQTGQRWGTPMPVTIRDKEFGAVRLRANGIYSYHVTDPAVFHQKVAATQGLYTAEELEPHLRNVIVGKVSDAFGQSGVAFLDMAGNIDELSTAMRAQVGPLFTDFGLALDTFQVESLSLPDELQKLLDQRIGMNMVGDMRQYAQFQAAQSMPIAAANPGGGAGIGAGLGAGLAMGKAMADAISGAVSPAPSATPSAETKFCSECGKPIAKSSKFCSECGAKQA
jgi:membrane protease subunit (stomatin/prohibitin family)